MPLFDFRCANGHVTEAIRSAEVVGIACSRCARMARRNGVNRGIGIVGPTTDTRGMFRRYQEATAEIDHAASTVEANTGEAVRTPPFWLQAKQRAAAMSAAGESPVVSKERYTSAAGLPAPPA